MRIQVARVLALAILGACTPPPPAPPVASPPPRAPAVVADAAAACQDLRGIESVERAMSESTPSPEGEPFGTESRVAHGETRCSVADDNIGSLEDAILNGPEPVPQVEASPAPLARDRAGVARAGQSTPRYLDRIDRRFALEPKERAMLAANGFVVPARLTASNYGAAFHDIYQSELPIFVTSDAILHAVYAGNDKVLSRVEQAVLEPTLRRALAQMTCALPAAAVDYPPDVARDVDVYLGVAVALMQGESQPTLTALGHASDVAAIVRTLEQGGLVGAPDAPPFVLFGRPRVVDASMFTPRGHYTMNLTGYFRSAMWLSRLELNLVSRSSKSSASVTAPDPSETPREDLDALALADLAVRSGALPLFAKVDRAWSVLAGRREDVSLSDLVMLRQKAGIRSLGDTDAAARLRAAIGAGWRRTARTHFTPSGATELPVIATVLGPRIGPDTAPTKRLVEDVVPGRFMLHAADMAYVLGSDRAKVWLTKDLADHPTLGAELDLARRDAQTAMAAGEDLYSLWLRGIGALAATSHGVAPSFMGTTAWSDERLDTTITAFGQLRHNYVLMAAGTYDSFGCEIPDGYVEPAPEMLDAIIAYAERGASALKELDPKDASSAVAYFGRVVKIARTLRRIVARELAGEPLRDEEKRFLGMVAEYSADYQCWDSCAPPTYTGWWYDLFIDRIADGTGTPEFIADYYASTNLGQVAYIGAKSPRLGVFVVDTNGPPRAMVGPVARGYEHVGPLDNRLADAQAADITDLVEPWAASYTVPAPEEPPLAIHEVFLPPPAKPKSSPRAPVAAPVMLGPFPGGPPRRVGAITLEARSQRAIGSVTVELVDHHRQPIASVTHVMGTLPVRFVFSAASIKGGAGEAAGVRVLAAGSSFVSTDSFDVVLGAAR